MGSETMVMVRVSRQCKATAEQVFDALVDPKRAGRFMFATPTGQMVKVEVDARTGGKFLFVDRRDGKDVAHRGEYLEVDRPHQLSFKFEVDGAPSSRVDIFIVSQDEGCEVTLSHELAAGYAKYAEKTQDGWKKILDGLAKVLGE